MPRPPEPITSLPTPPGMDRNEPSGGQCNVGEGERWASVLGGGALALYGLMRRSPGGTLLALLGGALVYRGATGHCPAYSALGISTAIPETQRIHAESAVIVNRPREEIFGFWRDFENLPAVFGHLQSVENLGENQSYWVAEAPTGERIEWRAEVVAEKPSALVSWHSLEGTPIVNAGSVRLTPTRDRTGTELRVTLEYRTPPNHPDETIPPLMGLDPQRQLHDDLLIFKQLFEAPH